MKVTTIKLSLSTRRKLQKCKLHPREISDAVVRRLCDAHLNRQQQVYLNEQNEINNYIEREEEKNGTNNNSKIR